MKVRSLFAAFATCALLCTPSMAQEKGQWRAASTTARGVTGDVAFSEIKISLNFSAFTLAQIRTLQPGEAKAVFGEAAEGEGSGNLYRTSIPAEKRFLHKNTLCGSEETQWVVSYVSGHNLQLAFFSGAQMPQLTAEAVSNTPTLCGTYAYVR